MFLLIAVLNVFIFIFILMAVILKFIMPSGRVLLFLSYILHVR
jgi:hypothetical protein